MLEVIPIPPASPNEERRLLARAIHDLYQTMDIIVEHAGEFLPGEAVDEVKAAWNQS